MRRAVLLGILILAAGCAMPTEPPASTYAYATDGKPEPKL